MRSTPWFYVPFLTFWMGNITVFHTFSHLGTGISRTVIPVTPWFIGTFLTFSHILVKTRNIGVEHSFSPSGTRSPGP